VVLLLGLNLWSKTVLHLSHESFSDPLFIASLSIIFYYSSSLISFSSFVVLTYSLLPLYPQQHKAHGRRVFRDFHAEFFRDAAGDVPVHLLVGPH
jgi:hypothetical protein